jgi:CrcB protein
MTVLWVALGSALGGAARFWCSDWIARLVGETFPWGTLSVNVVGSLLIGLFWTLTVPDGRLLMASDARQFVMVGLFGGFTTFSTFSLQTLSLLQDGQWLRGCLYVLGSIALCLLGVWFGHTLGVAANR